MKLDEKLAAPFAMGRVVHSRPTRFFVDPKTGDRTPDPTSYEVIGDETVHNVVTTAGIDFLFAQGYSTSTGANGLNYIALSNDTVGEATSATVLTNEIVANGLSRAIGTYNHTASTATATVAKTFTASGAQSCQKAALFSAGASGTMNHVLAFTQRALISSDTIAVTFTITLASA